MKNVAVLIDGENISAKYAKKIYETAAQYGEIGVIRVYGDYSSACLKSWNEPIIRYNIEPVHAFGQTKMKNSADISMTIAAMELQFYGKFPTICIVSTDSDFTSLATHLRNLGVRVIGMGCSLAINTYRMAFDQFICLDQEMVLRTDNQQRYIKDTGEKIPECKLRALIDHVLAEHPDRCLLTYVGQHLATQVPRISPRQYGYKNLSSMISSLEGYEVEAVGTNACSGHIISKVSPEQPITLQSA